jgi:hypothetical protein
MKSITLLEKDRQALEVVLRKLSNMTYKNYELLNDVHALLENSERELFEARKYRYRNSAK